MPQGTRPIVLKLGGELVEGPDLALTAVSVAQLARRGPLVVVHGGGREIDVELAARGIPKRAVNGVRVTDEATLEVVVGVLAGRVNTRLVAACAANGVPAVGLTGADHAVAVVEASGPVRDRDGTTVDLQRVGQPVTGREPRLLLDLCRLGYAPIVASIGADREGRLYNVNADTFAAYLAAAVGAEELIVAGATAGVLDEHGQTIPRLDVEAIAEFIDAGSATAGMVAKLVACRDALAAGVRRVFIVDGRAASGFEPRVGTEIGAKVTSTAASIGGIADRVTEDSTR